jgi:hypothetical protein
VLGGPADLEHVIRDLGSTLGPWTYALVGVMAFLETGAGIGLIAPGELAVILGGVAAGQGEVELVPLIALVWGAPSPATRCPTSSGAGSDADSCSSTATGSSSAVELARQGSFAIAGVVALAAAAVFAVKRRRRRMAAETGR